MSVRHPFSWILRVFCCICVYLCLWRLSLSLSLTRCSQGVIQSRMVQWRKQDYYVLRSSQGLVPYDGEDCRGGVPRQRYAEKFSSLLQWSSSISVTALLIARLYSASIRRSMVSVSVSISSRHESKTVKHKKCAATRNGRPEKKNGSRHLTDCQLTILRKQSLKVEQSRGTHILMRAMRIHTCPRESSRYVLHAHTDHRSVGNLTTSR